jgi:hypothetical protein
MSKLKIFLIFLLLTNISIGQIKERKGIVFDIFNNRIDGAIITNLRTNQSTISDCDGRFMIKSNRGDSISIKKENYLFHLERISRNRKMKILLNFDILNIKSKIAESEKAKLIDYPSYISCRCQPLLLIDGEPYLRIGPIYLGESSVKNTKILKGTKATDMFGEYASSGAIILATICGYDFDFGQ